MVRELIPLKFEKVAQAQSYTCIVLSTEEKKIGIYTSLFNTKTIQDHLSDESHLRPSTHELIELIFSGLEIKVKHIIINDLDDTVYFARLYLEQRRGDLLHIVEIDARPSDCITLALLERIPIYCTKEIFDKAIPYFE